MEQRKEINIQLEQKEETQIQKKKGAYTTLHVPEMPEGGEEETEIVNLFEKIMKENFPSLVKEIDIQGTAKQNKKEERKK